ncbi:KH homology domain-containing protein 4-like isoform X2 [Dendronephthya gigantea]|uniref:KH homology domain-containing protein 4-like isoform X2 n=1 Tax=Dendronephthya gigantea TaxID=151771 RepID=UPI00106AC5DB|nr:KH homology domain-containing protein 4-like isoform X2 [Dendronephthya gigantea]
MAATRDQNGRKRASKWDTPAPNTGSATEAAREAARKLNAMLAAKGKLTTNSTPPLLPPKPKSTAGTTGSSTSASSLFTEEIEINDSPKRLLLCQSNVQFEINKYSGAAIMIKGQYIAPSEKGNMTSQKPLYLLIQSPFKDKVNLAVQRIKGIMNGEDPFTPPPFPPQMPQSGQTSTLPSGMYYIQEKVFIGLDNVQPEFNLREKIVGPGESYFQHITKETGAKVCLRGRGSGFMEPTSGREAFEALYVYISHTNYAGLGSAKKLVENLIQTVHTAYQQFLMQQTSNSYYPNYAGYPSQNTGPPQNPPPVVYNMPPVSGYGPPPGSGGPQPPSSYPSYQYLPPNRPPPHYNQQSQPVANPNIPHGPPMHSHSMYPNPGLRHEGPRPLMDQHPTYGEPRPSPENASTLYTPDSPTQPCPSPTQSRFSSDDRLSVSDSSDSDIDVKSKRTDETPSEQSKPAKRRFTEVLKSLKILESTPSSLKKPNFILTLFCFAPFLWLFLVPYHRHHQRKPRQKPLQNHSF